MSDLGMEYLATISKRFKTYKKLGEDCFSQLEEKDFHFLPSPESNSIAIIVQHMSGNMLSRFTNFLTEDGEKEWRVRDGEFEMHSFSKAQILEIWEKGWTCVLNVLESLSADDLLKTVTVRKEPLTAMDAINRQLAHYTYHTGQIIMLGKMIRDKNWKNLSVPKGQSQQFNRDKMTKETAKN